MSMRRSCVVLLALLGTGVVSAAEPGETPPRDRAVYVDETKYPVLDEMEEQEEALRAEAERVTREILERIEAEREEDEESARELRIDPTTVDPPPGPGAFGRAWHHPPRPQYRTGTCWSFAGTSYLEAEVMRRQRRSVKLSEMWTVYWETLAKVRQWVERRGESAFGQGSQANAVLRVWSERGVVPRSAYEGTLRDDGRFDHARVHAMLRELLAWCRDNDLWDADLVVQLARSLLDHTMGRPPESFGWEDELWTPRRFMDEVVRLDPDEYVALMSTTKHPFYERHLFDVPDNWWFDEDYVNVPLELFYRTLRRAILEGSGAAVAVDVSEPGYWGLEDFAVVPTFDVPPPYIDQSAREMRIANGATTDDHAVHVVGSVERGGHEWFLIKDSNRSSRLGSHEGYMMYRGDYVRLKVLSLLVHRDVALPVLEIMEARSGRTAP